MKWEMNLNCMAMLRFPNYGIVLHQKTFSGVGFEILTKYDVYLT